MQNRVGGFLDVTGLALVRRIAFAGVCVNSYEEHTPEPWNTSRLSAGLGGGAREADYAGPPSEPPNSGSDPQLRAASSAPPPPPPRRKERIVLGAPLLPERAHDPYYYPGVNDDAPVDFPASRPWRRWAAIAAGGLSLFVAGVVARGSLVEPDTWSVVIETAPEDARVRVDGQPLTGHGTHTRAGLIAGAHVLEVEREGYEPHRQVFTLTDGDRRIAVRLEPAEPAPPAVAEVAAAATPSAAPTEPGSTVLQPLSSAEEPDDGAGAPSSGERKLSRRELLKQRRIEERRERVAHRYRERRAARAARAAERSERRDAPATRAAQGGTGFLKLNSVPWSKVYVNGRLVGHTPILKLELPAGRHTLKLKNPDLRVSKTVRIKIAAGETLTKVERLERHRAASSTTEPVAARE